MKENFPIALLTNHSTLPDEQSILIRLQGLLQSESHTTQDDVEIANASPGQDSASAVNTEETTETQTADEAESEDLEANDSLS